MANQIDYRRIEAGMRQGRIERAIAFRQMTRALSRGLRNAANMIATIFA